MRYCAIPFALNFFQAPFKILLFEIIIGYTVMIPLFATMMGRRGAKRGAAALQGEIPPPLPEAPPGAAPVTMTHDLREGPSTMNGVNTRDIQNVPIYNANNDARTQQLEETIFMMQGQLSHMEKKLAATQLSMSESEASQMLPTTYNGAPHIKDKSTYPHDMFIGSMTAFNILDSLISRKADINWDDPALERAKLLSARCARLTGSYVGALVAAQSVEKRFVGQFVDNYYINDRPNQMKEPCDKDGDIDSEKLVPTLVNTFDRQIQKRVTDMLENNDKATASAKRPPPQSQFQRNKFFKGGGGNGFSNEGGGNGYNGKQNFGQGNQAAGPSGFPNSNGPGYQQGNGRGFPPRNG